MHLACVQICLLPMEYETRTGYEAKRSSPPSWLDHGQLRHSGSKSRMDGATGARTPSKRMDYPPFWQRSRF
ncbi:hypothetical protein ASY01nite_19690 [Acetobacter syzygii]|nr:hypothetical protein ASY01nite_19690 [Acetobacter syzygii]